MKVTIRDKSAGFYTALAAAVFAAAGLVLYFIYLGKGGEADALVIIFTLLGIFCPLSYLFYRGGWSVIPSVLMPVFFAVALGQSLAGGVGNIADWMEGINLFGNAALVPFNFAMTGIYGVACAAGIVACFMPVSRRTA